jgi:ATP-dependent protease ClpP protease subunit
MYKLMAEWCGKTTDQIHRDFDRNKWLFAEEAVAYGCCDKVLKSAPDAPRRMPEPESEEKE